MTRGEAAVGIRIDAAKTRLTVPAGTRVQADGTKGAGLLVAYGRDTKAAVQGEITAKGQGGTAVRFDFGGNYLGDGIERRGSYLHKVLNADEGFVEGALAGPDERGYELYLDGPLVETFTLTGSLEGKEAAIYIGENAFVRNINVISGARIQGDIVSLWDANNPLLHKDAPGDLYTSLVFGSGTVPGSSDGGFALTLEGSVHGASGINMELRSGILHVAGAVNVHDLTNEGWLDIRGFGGWQTGSVSGEFRQGGDGVLQSYVAFDGRSTFLRAGTGVANGRWAVTPVKGYWTHNKSISITEKPVIFSDGTQTSFSSSLLAKSASLTLSFDLLDQSGSRPVIRPFRSLDAYSRHATRDSGAWAGRALVLANRHVPSQKMQALMTEIDFLNANAAIDRALSQLSADSFSEAFAHALGRQQALNQRLLQGLLSRLPKGKAPQNTAEQNARTDLSACDEPGSERKWTVWGNFFGMADKQSAYGSSDGWYSTGSGFMGGMDKDLGDGLALGFDLSLVTERFEVGGRQDADGSSQGVFLGVHGSFAPAFWNGAYLLGAARFGFDFNRMNRSVTAGTFHRSHESEWTDRSFTFMLGTGYDWIFGENQSARLGPLATLQYTFASHPNFEEDGDAEALRIEGGSANALSFLLAIHLGAKKDIGSNCALNGELMAGWRHELLEGSIRTEAAFAEHSSASFTSTRHLKTRDAGVLQASLRLAHEAGWFAELDFGGEIRTAGAGLNGGLRVGFEF